MRPSGIRIAEDFGIVIRKQALSERHVTIEQLFTLLETTEPYDEDAHLLSFGPHFGIEAAEEFQRRLQQVGFQYLDDFFIVDFFVPPWIEILAVRKLM